MKKIKCLLGIHNFDSKVVDSMIKCKDCGIEVEFDE